MKLIDKDALVAKIERRIKINKQCMLGLRNLDYYKGTVDALSDTISSLDTLEVKEVGLEDIAAVEWDDYVRKIDGEPDTAYMLIKRVDYIALAKHFFELGLNARIDKELVEEVYSHIDSIKDTADRMTSGNFMHNRAAIKFSANTIAKVLELMGLKAQKGE